MDEGKWKDQGQIALRELGDGRVWIYRKIYTWAICIGQIGDDGWDDTWCYETFEESYQALLVWDPLTEDEPEGWFRNPTSGRRRPNGDREQEYVHG